jgi:RecA-family ATPase
VKDTLNLDSGPNEALDPVQTFISNLNMSNETYKNIKINHYNIDGATMDKVIDKILRRNEIKMPQSQFSRANQETKERLYGAEEN